MCSCTKILWLVDLAVGAGGVSTAIVSLRRNALLHGGKISLLESIKRGLKSPSGAGFGPIEHEMCRTRLNALSTKVTMVLSLDGGLHDFSEGVAAALEDVRPQHLIHPHFGDRSSVDGLLGVIVLDEVDRELVLVDRPHGDGWARRDRRIVSQRVRELYHRYLTELDGFFLDLLNVGDYIVDDRIVFLRII